MSHNYNIDELKIMKSFWDQLSPWGKEKSLEYGYFGGCCIDLTKDPSELKGKRMGGWWHINPDIIKELEQL